MSLERNFANRTAPRDERSDASGVPSALPVARNVLNNGHGSSAPPRINAAAFGGSASTCNEPAPFKIGIYGWRKRCLYLLILFVLVVAILNLALTLWIVRIMRFHSGGMGAVRIGADSLTVAGDARFLRPVYAERIAAAGSAPLLLESAQNVTLRGTKPRRRDGDADCGLVSLSDDALDVTVDDFWVKTCDGETLLRARGGEAETLLGGESVSVINEGGAAFAAGVETKKITAPPSESLEIVSKTNRVNVMGSQGVVIAAKSGGVTVEAMDNVVLTTKTGEIRLEADLRLSELPVVDAGVGGGGGPEAHQLCVCANGRVFLERGSGRCREDASVCA